MVGLVMGGAMIAKGLIGGIGGRKASRDAARVEKETAKENAAELFDQARKERVYRSKAELAERRQYKTRRESIKGMYSKSGLLMTGTPKQAVTTQKQTDEYNIGEANEASEARVEAINKAAWNEIEGGQGRADALRERGNADMIGGLFDAGMGAITMYSGIMDMKANATQDLIPDADTSFDASFDYSQYDGWAV